MSKAFANVKSGFDLIPAKVWFKATVAEATLRVSKGDQGKPPTPYISLTYSISEPEGQFEGRKGFDTCMLAGKGAGMGRAKLETVRPDIDWGDVDLPADPAEAADFDMTEVKELLEGYEIYVTFKHQPRRDNPKRQQEAVADTMPADADVELWDGELDAA